MLATVTINIAFLWDPLQNFLENKIQDLTFKCWDKKNKMKDPKAYAQKKHSKMLFLNYTRSIQEILGLIISY